MSKRSRAEEDAGRRTKPIPSALKSEVDDTCFFFVKLLNGKTATADLPLDTTTAAELVKHLVSKQHLSRSSDRELYLVVGRRCAAWTQTLREAGVTRDCTVSVLCRLPSTKQPEIMMAQELLEKLAGQLGASGAGRASIAGHISSELAHIVNLPAKEVAESVDPLKRVVQLCTTIAQHPMATAEEGSAAVNWLFALASLARTRLSSDQLLGDAGNCCQNQITAVAGLVELWLTAAGAHTMVTLYSAKANSAGQEADGSLLDGSLAPLQSLTSWLDEPPAVPLPDRPLATPPGLLFGRHVEWTRSGQSCLVQLMAACDWEDLQTPAALMQCITLMAADHALSSFQHQFRDLPGLSDDSLTHSKARKSQPGRVAAAGQATELPVQLQLLAHASQLLAPILSSTGTGAALAQLTTVQAAKVHYAKLCYPSYARWQVLEDHAAASLKASGWRAQPAGALALQMAKAVALSAAARQDPTATAVLVPADIADMNMTALFNSTWRPAWNVMPLLHTVFGQLEGFVQFVAAARLPMHSGSTPKSYMPAYLANPQGLLPLLEAWYVMEQQASGVKFNREDYSDAFATLSDMLLQLVPFDWLQHSLKKLRPRQVRLGSAKPGKVGDVNAPGVAAALCDLLAWVPQLAGSLSPEASSTWLEKVLFPPPGDAPPEDDDDGDVEEFGGVHLIINRDELLADSINEVLNMEPQDLRKRIKVEFFGEDAYGSGVTREWLVQLSAQLFDPATGLFTAGATDLSIRHPVPAEADAAVNMHMRAAGRVIGLALRHRVPLGLSLSRPFYKLLTHAAALPAGITASSLEWLCCREADDARECREKLISGMAAWQRPHPWQAAATAVACCRQAELLQDLNGLQLKLAQQQQAASRSDQCHNWSYDGQNHITVARLVERAWRVQHTISDLQEIEPDMASSLKYLLENDDSADSLGLVWTAAAQQSATPSGTAGSSAAAAAAGEVELVSKGAEVCVTEDNKGQYIAALLEHKFTEACKQQVLWFFAGLADVADPAAVALTRGRLLLPLDVATFNAALVGSPAPLIVQHWMHATAATGGMVTDHSDILAMFWEVVEGFDDSQRRQLLRFWTGFTHLPATGFEGLGQQLQIMQLGSSAGHEADTAEEQAEAAAAAAGVAHAAGGAASSHHNEVAVARASPPAAAAAAGAGSSAASSSSSGSSGGAAPRKKAPLLLLPRAHTCFMQLLLPTSYTHAQQMREALLVALQYVDYFGHQ